MKVILLINAIVELLAGIIIILRPDLLLFDAKMDSLSLNLSRLYGIAAMLMGFISYLIFKYSSETLLIRYASLAIIGFHLFLTFHLYGMYSLTLLGHPGPFGFHLLLALITGGIYLRNYNSQP